METILVWFLIVSSNAPSPMGTQLGPYSDLESCLRVKDSVPMVDFNRQCIQVNIPKRPK